MYFRNWLAGLISFLWQIFVWCYLQIGFSPPITLLLSLPNTGGGKTWAEHSVTGSAIDTHTHTWQQQQTFSNTNTVKALTAFIIYNFQRRTVIKTNARHLRDMAPTVLQMIHSWEVLFSGTSSPDQGLFAFVWLSTWISR